MFTSAPTNPALHRAENCWRRIDLRAAGDDFGESEIPAGSGHVAFLYQVGGNGVDGLLQRLRRRRIVRGLGKLRLVTHHAGQDLDASTRRTRSDTVGGVGQDARETRRFDSAAGVEHQRRIDAEQIGENRFKVSGVREDGDVSIGGDGCFRRSVGRHGAGDVHRRRVALPLLFRPAQGEISDGGELSRVRVHQDIGVEKFRERDRRRGGENLQRSFVNENLRLAFRGEEHEEEQRKEESFHASECRCAPRDVHWE